MTSGADQGPDTTAVERTEVPPDVEVDVTSHWQFDEESFGEVLTYYGSSSNLQVRQRCTVSYSLVRAV